MTIIITLLAVLLVSTMSLIGVFTLSLNKKFLSKILLFLVSLAAGTLIGDVFLHILPEIFSESSDYTFIGLSIIAGLISFLVLEKVLHWRHCHVPTSKDHTHPLAITNLASDALHNFLDGIIIATAFSVSLEIGIATTIAVILHEIPQEIGDFGVLIHSGMKSSKALLFNFISALFAFLGAFLGIYLGGISESIEIFLLAFAAGGFIYIAVADLFPELKHEEKISKNLIQIAFVVLGVLAMYGLTTIEGELGHSHGGETHEHHEEEHDEDSEDHEEE